MKLYRFSPITTKEALFEAIEYIHVQTHALCKKTLGKHLQETGSLALFTHYPEEFEALIGIRKSLTSEENFNNKYFKFLAPIRFEATEDTPAATYKYIYIRHPDPYRSQVGDIDFVLEADEHKALQKRLEAGDTIPGVRPSPEDHLELIELHDPDMDVLSYLDTMTMEDLIKSA